jgi:hypothetical protein
MNFATRLLRFEKAAAQWHHEVGKLCSKSSSHAAALASDGARQSPRGESEPPAETLGPLGIADRLNWLKAKKRRRKTSRQ